MPPTSSVAFSKKEKKNSSVVTRHNVFFYHFCIDFVALFLFFVPLYKAGPNSAIVLGLNQIKQKLAQQFLDQNLKIKYKKHLGPTLHNIEPHLNPTKSSQTVFEKETEDQLQEIEALNTSLLGQV